MRITEKLENCPFCGYEGKLVVSEPYKTEDAILIDIYVVCPRCGASTQIQECGINGDVEEITKIVIRKWNTRINETQ